jgi:hypothetical protein
MKNILFLFATLFAWQTSQAQSAWEVFKGVLKSSAPQISSPFAQQMGITFRGHSFVVANGTQFSCRLFVGKNEVAGLLPGDIIWDQRHWQAGWSEQFAVAAVCYSDSSYSDFVGIAGRVLSLYSGGYPQAVEWVIRTADIRRPDGSYIYGYGNGTLTYPQPDLSAQSRKIKLPREWWNSTLGIQVVNNTLFTARIFANGILQGSIGIGGIMFISAKVLNLVDYSGRPIIISVIFEDRGRFVGTYSTQLWVPQNGILAEQIMLGPEYIWR